MFDSCPPCPFGVRGEGRGAIAWEARQQLPLTPGPSPQRGEGSGNEAMAEAATNQRLYPSSYFVRCGASLFGAGLLTPSKRPTAGLLFDGGPVGDEEETCGRDVRGR